MTAKCVVICALRLLLAMLGSRLITGTSGLAYQFQQRQTACGSLLSHILTKMGRSPSSRKIHFAPELHRVWSIGATGANADTEPLILLIVGDLGWLTEQGLRDSAGIVARQGCDQVLNIGVEAAEVDSAQHAEDVA